MRKEFLPFSRPSISEDDIASVVKVLRSGWITTGAQNQAFETAFSNYTGCAHAVALASATAGMHLLFSALGLGPGDEIITPSMTWGSTANLICLSGATPVFADIDRDTLMVSPQTIEPCVSDSTRMIIPVHFAGAAADMDFLEKLAASKDIFVAQDAAHAVGTQYKGDMVGATGTCIFSFHPIKNITTGEGGMFCTDDDRLAEKIRRLKFHGLGVDAFDRKTQGRSPQAEIIEPGFKYNLTDMSAALGISQLKQIHQFNQKREELASLYLEHLNKVDEILPLALPPKDCIHSWHLFIVRLDTDKTALTRDDFMEALKQRNIGTGIHFKAIHLQKYYRQTFGYKPGMLPNTEWNSDRICSLPLFPDMQPEDVLDVVNAIKDVLKNG